MTHKDVKEGCAVTRIIAIAGFVLLAGCSDNPFTGLMSAAPEADPLEDVDRLSDVAIPADAETAAVVATSSETDEAPGFFASFLSSLTAPATPAADPAIAAALAEATGEEAVVTEVAAAAPAATGGLFGFGARPAPPTDGPDARIIAFGEQIPFGELATVCDMPSNRLGTRIGAAAGFEIYDPIPNSTALRPQYITGFPDGCVRQFTAALTLMGDVGTHELVRYSSANRRQAYSATDSAYEAIKASYCRVGHGEPCGGNLDALSNEMTFLSVYRNFGGNSTWVEILLHDERVIAMDEEDL
jgi:hypothetical protein